MTREERHPMNVKWISTVTLAMLAAFAALGAQPREQALQTERELRSYALGMDIGIQFRKLSVDVDAAVFARGLTDALAGGKTLMTESEAKQAIARVQNDYKSRQILPSAGPGAGALADAGRAGEAFLAENRTKPGVTTLPSGLQYRVIVKGTGRRPGSTDTVVCQYRGTLVDGTEFDSSYARSQPSTFRIDGVIPGWSEALRLMPVGSKWQVVVPPQLAYGAQGAPPGIPPNATLVFDIELVGIK
jgi:FKBP-type peptidyl-prolyl cis-trans isomerase FklB